MRRFTLGVTLYAIVCLSAAVAIVLHGDGPHPRVASTYPSNGDRYWPGGWAQITFSQPMDQASVERALQVSPGTEGQGSWYGTTLNLQPVGGWWPDVTYHLALTGKVMDDQGRPLRTPIAFWFRVHHVHHLTFCPVRGIQNVCEQIGQAKRPLTHSPHPVLQYALSSDGTALAYIQRDESGLPHLFLTWLDGSGTRQLTSGRKYADSGPWWRPGDTEDISYYRHPIVWAGSQRRLGKARAWNVQTDGSLNAPL